MLSSRLGANESKHSVCAHNDSLTTQQSGRSFTPERRREVEHELLESYRGRMNVAGVAYDRDTAWRDYRFGSLWGLIITVLATSMAARTERGDDLFVKMATQHGHQAIDHDAMSLVS